MPWTSVSMTWLTDWISVTEFCTRLVDSAINWRTSLAADWLRWARLRTSAATTANPRPCSPARAASTAALSARMLVWKAMLSMVPMISFMRCDVLCSVPIPDMVWCIRPPARSVSRCSSLVSRLISWEDLALTDTVSATERTFEVACSRLAACDCVRPDRAWLSSTSSLPTWPSTAAALRTSATNSDRLVSMVWKRWPMPAISSRPGKSALAVRLPWLALSMAALRNTSPPMVAR